VSADKGDENTLADVVTSLMHDIEIPNGIGAVGFGKDDIAGLVEGSMKQQRLLAVCPREVDEDVLAGVFQGSLQLW
jgi:alcohol dehydrogenase class IV